MPKRSKSSSIRSTASWLSVLLRGGKGKPADWGKGYLYVKPFCKVLYAIMGWDEWFTYSVPAFEKNGVVFADLDNWVGKSQKAKNNPTIITPSREADESTRGFYIPPDSLEEVEIGTEDQAASEEGFGEAYSGVKGKAFPSGDLMTDARELGNDHSVGDEAVLALWEEMGSGAK